MLFLPVWILDSLNPGSTLLKPRPPTTLEEFLGDLQEGFGALEAEALASSPPDPADTRPRNSVLRSDTSHDRYQPIRKCQGNWDRTRLAVFSEGCWESFRDVSPEDIGMKLE